ncbi:protein FAM207A isoform X2 [Chiloscyllium plagiosum]|uniref:protein FAM207A isoform X2 n=1 Tax=Chiloscyllium plagiosum TaxID=36176 RepID=UPI001CB823F4|nr:protein FAM207A isoform X2 [Chiloscyllium plagiosum]
MVGKERRVRRRLHAAAVKLNVESRARSEPEPPPPPPPPPPPGGDRKVVRRDVDQLPTSLFAGTRIDPKILIQNLDVDSKTVVSSRKGDKFQISKKEKIKQRRERWLQKIEMIKLAEQKKKAQEKRKAIPVVGDMQPLADALPELTDLISASAVANKSKSSKKKPQTTPYSKMRHAQKRKLIEEEVARFQATIEDTEFKANPLAVIGEHLLKRMRQEDENLK